MEETTNKSGMSTGMIIGIAVIVAILFGGGAYAYVNNKAVKEKKDLNAQITELQSQVSSATTATTTTPSTSTSAVATTDPTAGWKTYTDTTYNFSIKYPADYTYKESKNLDNLGTGSLEVTFANTSDSSKDLVVDAVDLSKNGSNNPNPNMLMAPNGMDPVATNDITIAGQTGKDYTGSNGIHAYVTYKGTSWFSITGGTNTSVQSTLESMVNTMLFTK